MDGQLLAFFILTIMIQACIFLIYSIFYFGLSDKINKIKDTLRKHIENENELYNHLLVDKINKKIH